MQTRWLSVLLIPFIATACSGGGNSAGNSGSSSSSTSSSSSSSSSSGGGIQDIVLEPAYSSIQDELFTPVCTECHAGASPPQGLSLEADSSYAMLVGVSSSEVPSTLRVDPGNPDGSYLIQKLEGTASVGTRMPQNGPPFLTQSQIDVIRQWISDGATDDRTMSTAGLRQPARVVALNPQRGARLDAAPARVNIALDRPVDASLVNDKTVRLIASGGDGGFSEGNEHTVEPVTVAVSPDNPALITIDLTTDPPAADTYRVVISDNNGIAVATTGGVPIDGDSDGRAGGDFVSEFTVTAKP